MYLHTYCDVMDLFLLGKKKGGNRCDCTDSSTFLFLRCMLSDGFLIYNSSERSNDLDFHLHPLQGDLIKGMACCLLKSNLGGGI
jgi:hypothetical protein